jgi:hypothetical protein
MNPYNIQTILNTMNVDILVECDGLINEVSTFFDDITYLLLPKSNTLE